MSKEDFIKQVNKIYSENYKIAVEKGKKQAEEELRYKIYQRIVHLKQDVEDKKEYPKEISGAISTLEELLINGFPNLSGKMHDANQKSSEVEKK